jgi:hypothetical protein
MELLGGLGCPQLEPPSLRELTGRDSCNCSASGKDSNKVAVKMGGGGKIPLVAKQQCWKPLGLSNVGSSPKHVWSPSGKSMALKSSAESGYH